MMSLVYHCKKSKARRFPDDFELVAIVRSVKLEEALDLTTSTDCHWSENRKVKALKESARSTTIGDVAITPAGIFRLGPQTWEPITVTLRSVEQHAQSQSV